MLRKSISSVRLAISLSIFGRYWSYCEINSSLARLYSSLPFFAFFNCERRMFILMISEDTSVVSSSDALRTSSSASRPANSCFIHAPISLLYAVINVMPTTSAVCHDRMDFSNCFHTGTTWVCWSAASPLLASRKALFSSTARFNSSVSIGRLLEMARKNWLAPMVNDGNSRATCWIWNPRPLKALA